MEIQKTHKEKGWGYIRIKFDTIKTIRILKAELDLVTYDDTIKYLIGKARGLN